MNGENVRQPAWQPEAMTSFVKFYSKSVLKCNETSSSHAWHFNGSVITAQPWRLVRV